jgi:hypothetical protein
MEIGNRLMKKILPLLAGSLLLPVAGMALVWGLQKVGVIGPEATAFIQRNTLWIGLIALGITIPFAYLSSKLKKAKREQ